jgi:hypothetical protein
MPIFDSLLSWRWDNIETVWKHDYKIAETVYDVNGNMTNSTDFEWSGSARVKSSRAMSTFDVNKNEIAQISQNWSGSAWVNNYQDIWTYDANHNQTSELKKSWNGTAWENVGKSSGRLMLKIIRQT